MDGAVVGQQGREASAGRASQIRAVRSAEAVATRRPDRDRASPRGSVGYA